MKKIAVVFGTRPEIIKLSPVIRLLQKKRKNFFLLHTGQHYSYEMDRLFFKELELPEPAHQLAVRSKPEEHHGEHVERVMQAVEAVLRRERPKVVLVQGDTNSVAAGSLAAARLSGARLGHVEAGLRSYDHRMPEEINRVISDHVSDFLFVPTPLSRKILLGEGIPGKKIFTTGNTIVDAVFQNLRIARKKADHPARGRAKHSGYFLLTLHRQENVDDKKRLSAILKGLELVTRHFKTPILFPAHPRTLKRLDQFKLSLPEGVDPIRPVGFLDFLKLESDARLILTDSGGVQEEACILRVPCVTLRTSTERPETVQAGANLLTGHDPEVILRSARAMSARGRDWPNPFGDGKAAERIVRILEGAN
ncbi:MAG: non-hydrolyzing UDP-N-acetylglucosamine 2-epimerase [Candidatus Omnitrophota bacterium]